MPVFFLLGLQWGRSTNVVRNYAQFGYYFHYKQFCHTTSFKSLWYLCALSRFSHVQLFVTPWTVVQQAPLPMGFSRQRSWSGLPFPPPGIICTKAFSSLISGFSTMFQFYPPFQAFPMFLHIRGLCIFFTIPQQIHCCFPSLT